MLTLIALSALAAPPAAVTGAPAAADLPLEDGLWLWDRTTLTRGEAGVVQSRDTGLKVFSAKLDRDEHLDPRLSWDQSRSEIVVDHARCWLADGTEVVAGANSLVPNTAGALQWAVPYASQRQLVISQVGVEHGGTCQLGWTISFAPSDQPPWGVVPLARPQPVAELSVHVDVGAPLRWAAVYGVGAGEGSEGEVLDLALADVPAHDPAEGWEAPRLVWSSASSWDEVRAWLLERIDPAVAPEEVEAEVVRHVPPGTVQAARIAALHELVVDGVRTVDWPVDAFAWTPRPAAEVLDSSVGHPLDKAVLLLSLLLAADVDADLGFVASSDAIATDVPCPSQLDQVWVVVDEHIWLDPTGHHDMWDIDGRPVWRLVGSGGPQVLALPWVDEAVLRWELDLAGAEDGIAVSGTVDTDLVRRYHPAPGFSRDEQLRASVRAPAGAEVESFAVAWDSPYLASTRAQVAGGSIAVPDHGLARLELPRVPGAVDLGAWRSTRDHPLRLPGSREQVEVVLKLGGVEAVALPPAVDIAAPGAHLVRTVVLEDDVLTLREELTLEERVVSPAEWPSVREVLAGVETERARTVLFEVE